MNVKLQQNFNQLKENKSKFLSIIEAASPEQRRFKPTSNSWCMLEVLQHISEAERLTFDNISKYEPQKSSFWASVKRKVYSQVLNTSLTLPTKIKAPKVPGIHPKTILPFDATTQKWEQSRQSIYKQLQNFPSDKMGYTVFKHPIAGLLTLPQTLAFCIRHIKHHTDQLERIKASEGYPK